MCRYLGEVTYVNTDSVHIVCSTNCVRCTITDRTELSHSEVTNQVPAVSQNDCVSITEPYITKLSLVEDPSTSQNEPYTSEKLTQLRSGYKLLSTPSHLVSVNFNNQQVCNIVSLQFTIPRHSNIIDVVIIIIF